jgi:hypothetical protein
VVEEVFVPEHRTLANTALEHGSTPGRQINRQRMYGAISSASFTAAMATPAIGAGRGFLQAFEDRLRRWTRCTR